MSRYVPAHNNRPGAGQRAGTGQQLYPPRPSAPQPHYNNFNNPNPNATHIPPSITNANANTVFDEDDEFDQMDIGGDEATYMAIEMQASQMFSQLDVDGPNLGASLIGDALMDDKNVGMGMGMNVDDAALRFAAGDSGRTQSQFQIPHARPADESARLLQQTLEENKNLKAENERILREKNAKEGEVSNVRRSLAQANAENSNLRADLQRTANKAEKDLEEVKKNAERELEKWKTENGFLQNDVAEFKVALAAQRPQRMKHVTQATNDTFSKNRQWPDEKTTGPTSPAPIPIRVQKQDAATETAPESPKKVGRLLKPLPMWKSDNEIFLRQCMFASLPVGRDIFLTPTSLTALLPPYLSQCNSLNKMQTDGPHTTLIRDMRRLLVDASLDVAVLLPSVEGMVGGCLVELKYEPLVFLVHLLSTMCDHSAACREQITDLDSSGQPRPILTHLRTLLDLIAASSQKAPKTARRWEHPVQPVVQHICDTLSTVAYMVDKGRRASLRGVLSQSSLLLFLDKRQPREVVADVLGFVFHEICDEGFTDMIMDPSLKLNKRRSIPERMFGLLVNQPEEREVDEAVRTLDVRIINCLCALAGVWPKTIPGLCMPSITNRLVTYLQSARVGMDADETREPPHGWQTYRSTLRLLSTLLSHHSTHPIDPKISEPAIHTLIAVLARSVYAVRNLGGDEACAEVGDVAREMMGAVVVRPEEAYEEVFGGEFGEV